MFKEVRLWVHSRGFKQRTKEFLLRIVLTFIPEKVIDAGPTNKIMGKRAWTRPYHPILGFIGSIAEITTDGDPAK